MNDLGPGATIGVIGGGQLARMLAVEARRMGFRVAVLDPDPRGSGAQFADTCIEGALDDRAAADALARVSDVITLDTEHVAADLLAGLEARTAVRPGSKVLAVVQDRALQRRFLADLGAPQPLHAPVDDLRSLEAAAAITGFPCIIKSRRSGYDGRGQARAMDPSGLIPAWRAIGSVPAVLEAFVDYACEISSLLARDLSGHIRFFPVAENEHRNHVLHLTRVPARISAAQSREAESLGEQIAAGLDHVGMLAVELFVTRAGRLLVNEIAPRTHNSAHYTLGGCITSQFEQHVRAVCGLPLGDPTLLRPVAMLNLLGDLWHGGEPDWSPVHAIPSAKLHLYGKEARPGRKMGHVLIFGDDGDPVAAQAHALHAELERGAAVRRSA